MSDIEGVRPAGWPEQVDAPGRHGGPWEQSAAKWLFDQVPGEWRDGLSGPQYRRHPLMLARDADYLVRGQMEGLREAYRRARVDLAPHFEPQQIDEQLAMYAEEGARLDVLHRQVQLVHDALAGVRWIPTRAGADWSKVPSSAGHGAYRQLPWSPQTSSRGRPVRVARSGTSAPDAPSAAQSSAP